MKLHYFKLRGRGEPIRLALNAANVEYEDTADTVGVDFAQMKAQAGSTLYPCGQVPVLEDGDLILGQSDAIMRYIGRKCNMYGADNKEMSMVDFFMLTVEDIRAKYGKIIYEDCLSDAAKEAYVSAHIDPAGLTGRNGGAHFGYLDAALKRNGGGEGFVVGSTLTIADIQLFDIVDLHLREALFPSQLKTHYPALVAHHDRVAAVPGIAKYLASPRRSAKINGSDLG